MNRKFLVNAEQSFDRYRLKFKKKFNMIDPIIIYPYRGYANEKEARLFGRVLEKEGILLSGVEEDNLMNKLRHMFKRFESDEIPHIKLKATFDGKEKEFETDKEGFFDVHFKLDQPIKADKGYWQNIHLELLENPYTDQKNIQAEGPVLIPGKNSRFMVISDVDDTIIKSFATSTFLKIKTLLLETAKTRVPFPGVPAFYRALQQQRDVFNPLFFVSGSSWNIYDLLDRFCELHKIPDAPFFLRELGFDQNMLIQRGTRKFKKEKIMHLLEFYPELPVILIGDSGQKDLEIYSELAMDQPDRVNAIYIRQIKDQPLDLNRQHIVDELKNKGIDVLLMENTIEAAQHAAEHKWIDSEMLKEVEEEA